MIRFYGLAEAEVLSMPVRRFFVYARAIRILRAEETLQLVEVVSIPHMEKKARERTLRRIEKEAGGDAQKTRKGAKENQLIGGIPADAAALRAAVSNIPGMANFMTITKKKDVEKDSDT